MANWIIYYNPKCGTCRNTLQILEENGIKPRIVEYLKNPPALSELKNIARKLGPQWMEMARTKEPVFAELKLDKGTPSQNALLEAIAKHPVLLQRPIVIRDERAVVARPPEKVEGLLS